MTEPAKKIILSGMRPTGPLHLGNYVGALRNWIRLQDAYHCYFCIVSWHALSSEYHDSKAIKGYEFEVAVDWLSAGLDPDRCVMFRQSEVKEHAELHLILSMITPLPWVERVPTFKEQLVQLAEKDLNTYGFLGYPVLQAADIAIYRADVVPVGEDQAAHLELTREIVRRFNRYYGDVFPEPQTLLTEVPRLAGTDGRKMSKSYGNAIYLKDTPEVDPGRRSCRWSPTRGASGAPIPASRTTARSSPCTRPSCPRTSRRRSPAAAGRPASAAATARPSSSSTCSGPSRRSGSGGPASRRIPGSSGTSSRTATPRPARGAQETMAEVRAALGF